MPKGKPKKQNRSFLDKTAQTPEFRTNILNPAVARELPLIFGFENLRLDQNPFKCEAGNGTGLVCTLKIFILFCGMSRKQADGYKNCHVIPAEQIKTHGLQSIVQKSPSGRLHQLGKKKKPERIVGFYDKQINLFQVCLIDLKHNLSGSIN